MPSQVFIFITFETTKINVSFRQEEFYLLWWIWIHEMKEEHRASRKQASLGAGGNSLTWAPPSSPDVLPHRWTTAPQNPPNQHHKSCHSYSSKGRCQCFNECLINSPFFLRRWCHSRLVAQVGWSVRLLEGICSSLGTIIQRENINFSLFHALISKLLLLTEWSHLYYAGVAAIFWCLSQYCHFSLLKPTPTLQHWNCLM